MNDDIPENDALWRLLGKSSQQSASPFFARNVLREIRQSAPATPRRFWIPWLAPATFAALALGFFHALDPLPPPSAPPRASLALPEDFDPLVPLEDFPPSLEFTPAHLAGL